MSAHEDRRNSRSKNEPAESEPAENVNEPAESEPAENVNVPAESEPAENVNVPAESEPAENVNEPAESEPDENEPLAVPGDGSNRSLRMAVQGWRRPLQCFRNVFAPIFKIWEEFDQELRNSLKVFIAGLLFGGYCFLTVLTSSIFQKSMEKFRESFIKPHEKWLAFYLLTVLVTFILCVICVLLGFFGCFKAWDRSRRTPDPVELPTLVSPASDESSGLATGGSPTKPETWYESLKKYHNVSETWYESIKKYHSVSETSDEEEIEFWLKVYPFDKDMEICDLTALLKYHLAPYVQAETEEMAALTGAHYVPPHDERESCLKTCNTPPAIERGATAASAESLYVLEDAERRTVITVAEIHHAPYAETKAYPKTRNIPPDVGRVATTASMETCNTPPDIERGATAASSETLNVLEDAERRTVITVAEIHHAPYAETKARPKTRNIPPDVGRVATTASTETRHVPYAETGARPKIRNVPPQAERVVPATLAETMNILAAPAGSAETPHAETGARRKTRNIPPHIERGAPAASLAAHYNPPHVESWAAAASAKTHYAPPRVERGATVAEVHSEAPSTRPCALGVCTSNPEKATSIRSDGSTDKNWTTTTTTPEIRLQRMLTMALSTSKEGQRPWRRRPTLVRSIPRLRPRYVQLGPATRTAATAPPSPSWRPDIRLQRSSLLATWMTRRKTSRATKISCPAMTKLLEQYNVEDRCSDENRTTTEAGHQIAAEVSSDDKDDIPQDEQSN